MEPALSAKKEDLEPLEVESFISSPHPRVTRKKQYFPYVIAIILSIATLAFFFKKPPEENDIYTLTHFCDSDGVCHEKADEPSPRTIYSARSHGQYINWFNVHEHLVTTAKSYSNQRSGDKRPLLLLGDSITESWLGTSYGEESTRTKGVPDVLKSMLSEIVNPLVLAISGDQTQHLLWRLMNGELQPDIANDNAAIFVVMIGTNNLGAGELPGPTAKGIRAVAEYLLEHTKGFVWFFTLLPRGDGERILPKLCPPRCDSQGNPFKSFLPPIERVNKEMMKWTDDLFDDRFRILKCGEEFVGVDGNEVKKSLMPDLLHPNALGHRTLAACIVNEIESM